MDFTVISRKSAIILDDRRFSQAAHKASSAARKELCTLRPAFASPYHHTENGVTGSRASKGMREERQVFFLSSTTPAMKAMPEVFKRRDIAAERFKSLCCSLAVLCTATAKRTAP
jgi:hypothetical protein